MGLEPDLAIRARFRPFWRPRNFRGTRLIRYRSIPHASAAGGSRKEADWEGTTKWAPYLAQPARVCALICRATLLSVWRSGREPEDSKVRVEPPSGAFGKVPLTRVL